MRPPPLDGSTRLFYGLGSVGYGVKDMGFRSLLLIYYNQVMGLPAQWVAVAIMTALVVDSFIDPIIGSMSDNLRTRWGRRHPLMYAAAIPAGLSYVLLWMPPPGWGHEALFAYIVAVAVFVRSFIALYEIPSAALSIELTTDYDERTALMSYRYFFGAIGGFALSVLTFKVLLAPSPRYPVGQLNPDGYVSYGIVAGLVMTVSILASTWGTQHRTPYLPEPGPQLGNGFSVRLRENLRTLSHRSFLMLIASGFFKVMAIGVSTGLGLYIATYVWRLSTSDIAVLSLDTLVAAFVTLWAAPRLTAVWGKRRAAITLYILAVLVAAAPLGLRQLGLFWSVGSPWLLPTLVVQQMAQMSLFVCATAIFGAMFSDVVEDSQLQTGRRSEGLFLSVGILLQKATSGLGIFLTGLLLAMAHFPTQAAPGEVVDSVLDSLIGLYLPTLAILWTISTVFLAGYNITRERHEQNLRVLAQLREQREA